MALHAIVYDFLAVLPTIHYAICQKKEQPDDGPTVCVNSSTGILQEVTYSSLFFHKNLNLETSPCKTIWSKQVYMSNTKTFNFAVTRLLCRKWAAILMMMMLMKAEMNITLSCMALK